MWRPEGDEDVFLHMDLNPSSRLPVVIVMSIFGIGAGGLVRACMVDRTELVMSTWSKGTPATRSDQEEVQLWLG